MHALALELRVHVVLAGGPNVDLPIQGLWLVEREDNLHDTLDIAGVENRFITCRQLVDQHELWVRLARNISFFQPVDERINLARLAARPHRSRSLHAWQR